MEQPMKTLAVSLAALAVMAQPALAQEHSGHAAAAPATDLPAVCLADGPAPAHEGPSMRMEGDEAHAALMAGMDRMNADMMAGGMAADIDVAFICSMIPHHRGAIDMARAVIRYGDDPWAKALAEQIIAAQEQEIADMLSWLEAQ
jgi:uncharacterized protein (DUF305 family)